MFFKLTKEPDPLDPKPILRTGKKLDVRNTIQTTSLPNMASFFFLYQTDMTEISPTT